MAHPAPPLPPEARPYQLFMLAVSLLALAMLAMAVAVPMTPDVRWTMEVADTVICGFFLIDFAYNLATAPNRFRYLVTWGWLDLLAAIPSVGVLRSARLVRVVRVLRILRVVKAVRILAAGVTARRRESGFFAAVLVALLVTFAGSIAVLEAERDAAGANITSANDALWWAAVTVATVGYGDRFPVTQEGRIVAVALMAVGVGLFGTLSGVAASYFAAPAQEQDR